MILSLILYPYLTVTFLKNWTKEERKPLLFVSPFVFALGMLLLTGVGLAGFGFIRERHFASRVTLSLPALTAFFNLACCLLLALGSQERFKGIEKYAFITGLAIFLTATVAVIIKVWTI